MRVLVLAYHFPPIGGGGVQRNAKFVRYLPEFGVEPVVVTGPGRSQDRWAPEDETLVAEVPPETEVHRLAGPEPDPEGRWRSVLSRRLLIPPPVVRWWLEGIRELGAAVGSNTDLIYASLVPYDTAEAAADLAVQLGKPWVADLQDPWALDEMWLYPTAVHRRIDRRRMRMLLATAAAIVMNTPEAAKRLVAEFPELSSRIVVSIPNGFDPSDFEGDVPERRDGRFRIVHAGYLHTDQGLRLRKMRWARKVLGGTYAPIDKLTRSHAFLVQAVQRLIDDEPGLAQTFELLLAGALTDADRAVAAPYPWVELLGYVSHADTLKLLRTADLLFLPMHDLPPGTPAGLVPGKTYEYLATGRPILAAVPDGDARTLLAQAGNSELCRPADVDAMAGALHRELRRWQSGTPPQQPDPAVVARFERRALTASLAEVFVALAGNSAGATRGASKALVASPPHG